MWIHAEGLAETQWPGRSDDELGSVIEHVHQVTSVTVVEAGPVAEADSRSVATMGVRHQVLPSPAHVDLRVSRTKNRAIRKIRTSAKPRAQR